MMPDLTTSEQIALIDEVLEEPNSFDPRWLQLLTQYRRILMTRKMEAH